MVSKRVQKQRVEEISKEIVIYQRIHRQYKQRWPWPLPLGAVDRCSLLMNNTTQVGFRLEEGLSLGIMLTLLRWMEFGMPKMIL